MLVFGQKKPSYGNLLSDRNLLSDKEARPLVIPTTTVVIISCAVFLVVVLTVLIAIVICVKRMNTRMRKDGLEDLLKLALVLKVRHPSIYPLFWLGGGLYAWPSCKLLYRSI